MSHTLAPVNWESQQCQHNQLSRGADNHLTHPGVNMLGIWIVNVPFLCTYCLSFCEMLATCCYLKYLPFFRSLSHFFRYSECSSMHIPIIGASVSEPHTSVFNCDFSWFPSALPRGFEGGIYYVQLRFFMIAERITARLWMRDLLSQCTCVRTCLLCSVMSICAHVHAEELKRHVHVHCTDTRG